MFNVSVLTYISCHKSNQQEVGTRKRPVTCTTFGYREHTALLISELSALSIWVCLWEKYSVNLINNVTISVCALEFTIIFLLTSILKACEKLFLRKHLINHIQDRTHLQEAHNYFLKISAKQFIKPVFLRISGERKTALRCSQFLESINCTERTSGSSWLFFLVKYKTILGFEKAGLITWHYWKVCFISNGLT